MAVCRTCAGRKLMKSRDGRVLVRCPSCRGHGTIQAVRLTKIEARALFFRPKGWRVQPLEYTGSLSLRLLRSK